MEQHNEGQEALRSFIQKRMIWQFNMNIIANAIGQFYALRNQECLMLLEGSPTLVKAILPIMFFLPLGVSLDALNQAKKEAFKGKLPFVFKKKKAWAWYKTRIVFIHAGIGGTISALILLSCKLFSPADAQYHQLPVILFIVAIAASFAIIFTLRTFKLLANSPFRVDVLPAPKEAEKPPIVTWYNKLFGNKNKKDTEDPQSNEKQEEMIAVDASVPK